MHKERQRKLTDALQKILLTLKSQYKPDRVISLASENVGEGSDIDLVIVKDTQRPFLQLVKQVALLCGATVGVLIIWSIHRANSRRCLRRKIRLLSTKFSAKEKLFMSGNLAQRWLDSAGGGLIVARQVLEEGHAVTMCVPSQQCLVMERVWVERDTALACFASQRCAEESLIAFLIAKTNDHPRVHKLVDLLSECQKYDVAFSNFCSDCTVINQFYVPTRFPYAFPGMTPGVMPSAAEAGEAIALAERILQFVKQRI